MNKNLNFLKSNKLMYLTVPIFLELLLMTVVGNIDILMVSKFSDKAVGVLGGMSQVLYTQNVLFSFVSIGTGILVAQYIGAKKTKKINEVIAVSLVLNLALSLIVGGIYFGFSYGILTKIKLSQELLEIGINYFRLVGGFCIFQAITVTVSAALRSYGYTKEPLYISVIVNILNIIGNGMFLFGWMGSPVIGVTGVGIATVFARFIGAIISIYMLLKFTEFQFIKEHIYPLPKDIFKYIGKIGIPSGMEHLSWNTAQIIILAMVNTMGTDTIAARTYLNLIASFMMMFSLALGHGTAIMTGQLIGAKKIEEAYTQLINSLKLSLVIVTVISLGVIAFQNPIIGYFTKDPEIVKIAKKVIWIFLIIETGRTFNIVIINSLHAAGDVKYPMIVGIIFMFGIAVTLSWILGIKLEMALVGVWLANSADEWIRGILMYKRWQSRKWTKKAFVH